MGCRPSSRRSPGRPPRRRPRGGRRRPGLRWSSAAPAPGNPTRRSRPPGPRRRRPGRCRLARARPPPSPPATAPLARRLGVTGPEERERRAGPGHARPHPAPEGQRGQPVLDALDGEGRVVEVGDEHERRPHPRRRRRPAARRCRRRPVRRRARPRLRPGRARSGRAGPRRRVRGGRASSSSTRSSAGWSGIRKDLPPCRPSVARRGRRGPGALGHGHPAPDEGADRAPRRGGDQSAWVVTMRAGSWRL